MTRFATLAPRTRLFVLVAAVALTACGGAVHPDSEQPSTTISAHDKAFNECGNKAALGDGPGVWYTDANGKLTIDQDAFDRAMKSICPELFGLPALTTTTTENPQKRQDRYDAREEQIACYLRVTSNLHPGDDVDAALAVCGPVIEVDP